MAHWIAYSMPPLDHGWERLPTVKDVASNIASQEATLAARGEKHMLPLEISSAAFLSDWEEAQAAATQRDWEGDFKHEPVVLWLPTEEGFQYAFAFKQDNNGTSFVVSSQSIPWLAEWSK